MITAIDLTEPLEFVARRSRMVAISENAINLFVNNYSPVKRLHWDKYPLVYVPRKSVDDEIDFLFLISSQAFCFWGYPDKWTITYQEKKLDGWWAMIACFDRAYQEGIPVLEGAYLADLDLKKVRKLFEGTPEIPLIKKRLEILRDIGRRLVVQYSGRFHQAFNNLTEFYDAIALLNILADFSGFNDVASYCGRMIPFYKKAQVFIYLLRERFTGRGFRELKNYEKLTGHADYKIPAVMRSLGILRYAQPLAEKVDRREPLAAGSGAEVEIRANTLWSLQLIGSRLKSRKITADPQTLSGYFWNMGQEKKNLKYPYHLTSTIYY